MTQGRTALRIGEVVEASSTAFTAQCYRLYDAPPLGAFVRAGSPEAYAVVASVTTEPLDPSRPTIARGEGEETEEDIYRSNPQLVRLLCTRFQALIVGHSQDGALRHYLPPSPPRIHAFVYPCTPQEVARLTEAFDFVHLLVAANSQAADEVTAACLRLAAPAHANPRDFLVRAGKALALELGRETVRLNAVLRRLAP